MMITMGGGPYHCDDHEYCDDRDHCDHRDYCDHRDDDYNAR